MIHVNSSSSTATPGTIANTACYDPFSKCIKLPPASSDGGAILEGSIIEMDTPPFQPGKLLLGEIVEIVILDENMSPLAVHDEKTAVAAQQHHMAASPALPTVPALLDHSLSREELLQKQREQQQLHFQQSQELLQKHQQEQQQLDSLHREGRLSDDGKEELSIEMDLAHQVELAKLQNEHHSEQTETMNLIFESASGASQDSRDRNAGGKQLQQQQTIQNAPEKKSSNLWNRAAVATVAAGTITQSRSAENRPDQSQLTNEKAAAEKKSVGLWNRAAVATVAAGTINQSNNATDEMEQPQSEKRAAGLWNRAAVATVAAGTINQNSNAASPPAVTSKKKPEKEKQGELTRREEVQLVMKDQTLGREEKQKRLAEIKAKYASLASSQAQAEQSTPTRESSPTNKKRWNRAAVSAVTANTMSHVKQEQAQEQAQQAQEKKNAPKVSRWKLGAASALSANTFNKSYKNLKEVQGATTPMSEFIQKVKSNDPSLTAIVLDGRKGVTNDEWTSLFDALEDNAILTHLSVANCDLDDDTVVPLVLALVENETMVSLNLTNNRNLTNGTGKSLVKVLKQSNSVIKKVDIEGTAISSKTSGKMRDILDDRDDVKKLEKIQASRQSKIKDLLAFSASDQISPSSQRLSQRLLEIEGDGDHKKSINSGSTNSSGDKKKKRRKGRAAPIESASSFMSTTSSQRSSGSGGRRKPHSASLTTPRKTAHSASMTSGGSRIARSNAAARQMASLGGEVAAGKSLEEVRQNRKLRGECEDCGQRLFQKTMFKTIPLTIPNKVHEGRCLECATITTSRRVSDLV
ncbi:hypothetical protein ACHAXR_004863 [Thalassiosira sp. AJA248-18]